MIKVIETIKKRNYVIVKFDNEAEILIHYELFLSENIFVDREFSQKKIDEILDQETINKIKFTALYYLGRRAHSKTELYRKLKKKEYPSDLIEKSLFRLEELGYIDDKKFAELYFEEKLYRKKKGINKVIAELYQKGVSREIINDVSYNFRDHKIHDENALKLAERKLISLKRKELEKHQIKSKLYSHLQMKGFQSDTINKVFTDLDL